MPLTNDNLFMNWYNFTWTKTGGSLVTITRVSSAKTTVDAIIEKFKGDGATFTQAIAAAHQERMIEVDFGDAGASALVKPGDEGAMTISLGTHKNGVTTAGGGLLFTLSSCVVTKRPISGDHAKFATTALTFEGFVLDGTTDPLVITTI